MFFDLLIRHTNSAVTQLLTPHLQHNYCLLSNHCSSKVQTSGLVQTVNSPTVKLHSWKENSIVLFTVGHTPGHSRPDRLGHTTCALLHGGTVLLLRCPQTSRGFQLHFLSPGVPFHATSVDSSLSIRFVFIRPCELPCYMLGVVSLVKTILHDTWICSIVCIILHFTSSLSMICYIDRLGDALLECSE